MHVDKDTICAALLHDTLEDITSDFNKKIANLVDGGITDWIGKILSDSKEKCITSGMGLEYLGKVYKKSL